MEGLDPLRSEAVCSQAEGPREEGRRGTGWRRAAFHWVDAQSGQRLRLSLEGPPDLLARLEAQGFEPLTDDPRSAAEGFADGRAELEP